MNPQPRCLPQQLFHRAPTCVAAEGFVLAGGRSSRMGRDKALVDFAGKPLIAHSLGILNSAGLPAAVAGARSQLPSHARVIPDAEPDQGPLGGICSALDSTSAEYAIFLSVDVPLLPASLILYLLHRAALAGSAVTVSSLNGFPQTFPAVLARDTAPVLERERAAGRLGCYAAFRAAATALGRDLSVLPVELLAQCGQVSHPDSLVPARWFLNINAPADLALAERVI